MATRKGQREKILFFFFETSTRENPRQDDSRERAVQGRCSASSTVRLAGECYGLFIARRDGRLAIPLRSSMQESNGSSCSWLDRSWRNQVRSEFICPCPTDELDRVLASRLGSRHFLRAADIAGFTHDTQLPGSELQLQSASCRGATKHVLFFFFFFCKDE